MKRIDFQIVIDDDGNVNIAERGVGFNDGCSSQLEIIGILENLKHQHLEKLNKLYEKEWRK